MSNSTAEIAAPRAIPEIEDELREIKDLLHGKQHVLDPCIRMRLGRRRRECKDEIAEANRRLRAGE